MNVMLNSLNSLAIKLNRALAGGSDLIIAGAVILILGMMIIPLPTAVMDVLIAINITTAALIMFATLYISDAAKFASLPTILLLTTLFRLAINVSSTRLILLQADAGEIIAAFGNFVVQGNFVVGLVVFLVLVVIQLIVIAKGSERVAEVCARFTLDAIPGKQMSIDADLRANTINQEEGSRRRTALERESQFYGAMDGAMKFVKGDAIAGIIIVAINIIGGITIGMLQMQLGAAEAAETFTILTIGDGLVSQIPALLMSVAAGMVVTRVAQKDAPEHSGVGREIIAQVLRQPRAILAVSAFLGGVGFLPGFPILIFLPLSAMLALLAIPGLRNTNQINEGGSRSGHAGSDLDSSLFIAPHPTPVLVYVHALLDAEYDFTAERDPTDMRSSWNKLRIECSHELGVLLPDAEFELGQKLRRNSYSISVFDCPVAGGCMPEDRAAALCTPQQAEEHGIGATPYSLPWNQAPACLVEIGDAERLRRLGYVTFAPDELVRRHVIEVMRQHAADFVGIQETKLLLDGLDLKFPALLQEVVPARLSIQQVAEVLQRLLREGVSIRDLRCIMESLARWCGKTKEPAELAELVRQDSARAISNRYSSNARDIFVYRLADKLEKELIAALRNTGGVVTFSPSADLRERTLQSVSRGISLEQHLSMPPIILTRAGLRRHLRGLIELEFPNVLVLAFEELATGMSVRAIGVLGAAPALQNSSLADTEPNTSAVPAILA